MTEPNQAPGAADTPPPARHPGRNLYFALGALAVAGVAFLVLAYGQIGENLVYYWSPSDMKAAGSKAVGATIRLGGMVVPGSVKRGEGSELVFEVTDEDTQVRVVSRSVPPQMFREGIGVVVEGTMTREGYFDSRRLMVSHGNEYKAPGDMKKANIRELIKSTKGLEGDSSGKGKP